ncbi:MAG: radical SAM protein [Propionibacteriaceae bacterium]|nr:radical SAM protein [Propionibacteriaceae bacterium]
MQISRAHYPVTVLGWGVRAGIWAQGCSIHCRACIARDTWPALPENDVPAASIMAWLESLPPCDGLTISGGEPLDQAADLVELLRMVRAFRPDSFDILCYTGRTADQVKAVCPEVFDLVDVLALGPFEVDLPSSNPLLGSSNQELLTLTDLGRERYRDAAAFTGGLQATVADDKLWLVGVPERGQLDGIRRHAAESGLILEHPSW